MDATIQAAMHAAGLDSFIPLVCALHLLASSLDALIPQPKPGSHWLPIRKVLSVLALNVANSTNANQPPLFSWVQRIASMLVAILPPPPAPTQAPQPVQPLFPTAAPVAFTPAPTPAPAVRVEPVINVAPVPPMPSLPPSIAQ